MSEEKHTNRLIHEKSPYLLQHAHNPIDWFPWGQEAFEKAKTENKPIFLSIGYATCHWCHVMEKESFMDEEIAKHMNQTFVNIKVDREERPEVDNLYMEFAQAIMSGGAGWPLNVVLTPDLMPFFATTYLPLENSKGMVGMRPLVQRIQKVWNDPNERDQLISQSQKIVDLFATHTVTEGQSIPSKEIINQAALMMYKQADPLYGGSKGVPKFPLGFQSCFLMQLTKTSSDSRALFYVEKTLQMMYRGGIYDPLGGGFARYSIDEKWLVPHFEKMLYDNVILARAYLEAWHFTKKHFYREVAEEILNYLLREMKNPSGAFFSAQDADSNGEEGHFYTWSWEEVQELLKEDTPVFCEFYGITPLGNYEGKNILHGVYSLEEFAQHHGLDLVELENKLKEGRRILFAHRELRPHPKKDEKIITAWNGLAIYTYAYAGFILDQEKYTNAAVEAAEFIKKNLFGEGKLYRRFCDGENKFEGCLDDYAFLIYGILLLFETGQGTQWLEFAQVLSKILLDDFKAPQGAFYLTNGEDPSIILRRVEYYDGAEPSGNGVHTENLLRLFQITQNKSYLDHALDIQRAAQSQIELYPPGMCYHLLALSRYYDPHALTILVSLNESEEHLDDIQRIIAAFYLPHKVMVWKKHNDQELEKWIPFSKHAICKEGKTTVYICTKDKCLAPLTDLDSLFKVLESF